MRYCDNKFYSCLSQFWARQWWQARQQHVEWLASVRQLHFNFFLLWRSSGTVPLYVSYNVLFSWETWFTMVRNFKTRGMWWRLWVIHDAPQIHSTSEIHLFRAQRCQSTPNYQCCQLHPLRTFYRAQSILQSMGCYA